GLRSVRDVPRADRSGRASGRLSRIGRADRLREREPQDQRRAQRSAGLPSVARRPTGSSSSRHDPHRAGDGVHRAGLRRRQVRSALAESRDRGHHPVGGRPHGGAHGPSSHVHVHAVLSLPTSRGHAGGREDRVRRSVLRHHERVRAELSALRHRPAGAGPDGHRGALRTHRREHLSGRDDARSALLPSPDRRLCGLPDAPCGTVPLRRGDASRRRRDGRVRVQRGPRDPPGSLGRGVSMARPNPRSRSAPSRAPVSRAASPEPASRPALETPPWTLVLPLLVIAAGLYAYHNGLHGPLIYDDLPAIRENPLIRTLWPPWRALSPPADSTLMHEVGRPTVIVSLAMNYTLGGLNVWGYHVVNVTVHL